MAAEPFLKIEKMPYLSNRLTIATKFGILTQFDLLDSSDC